MATTGKEIETYLWHFQSDPAKLRELGSVVTFPKNTVIQKAGEIPEYAYYILSGRVVSFEYTASGNERIYVISSDGSLLLDGPLLLGRPMPVSFKTTKETQVVRISRDSLTRAIMTDPQLAIDIINSNAEKLLSAMDFNRQSTSTSAEWKICNLLLSLADNYGANYDNKILIEEKISQQTIANILGLNRITTLRVMKELKDMSLVEQINGYYCIRSIEQLKKHMDFLEAGF